MSKRGLMNLKTCFGMFLVLLVSLQFIFIFLVSSNSSHSKEVEMWMQKNYVNDVEVSVDKNTSTNHHMQEDEKMKYRYVDESNSTALWLGEIGADTYEMGSDFEGVKFSMVISHCDKALDWIWRDFLASSRIVVHDEDIVIYSKCGNAVEGSPSSVRIINLPNVGRCDHTYAYHLCHLVSEGGGDSVMSIQTEIVLLMKDNPQRLEWWDRRSLDELVHITLRNGFGCIEQELEFNSIHPSFYHDFSTWVKFSNKDGYVREQDRDSNESFPSKYKDLGTWVEALNLNVSKPLVPVCYGGVFSATLAQIQSQGTAWCSIERSLSRANNIEEGHFSERTWAGLLNKPLSTTAIESLLSKKKRIMCRARWKNRCGALAY